MKSNKKKIDNQENLFEICLVKFEYLISEYNFGLVSRNRKKDPLDLVYQNHTTAVSIMFDRWENQFFVNLFQLEEGKLVQNPVFINRNTRLYGYNLDDILLVRIPGYSKFGNPSKNTDLSLTIEYYSKMLRQYAQDILQGDFSIFIKLDTIVKNRIE